MSQCQKSSDRALKAEFLALGPCPHQRQGPSSLFYRQELTWRIRKPLRNSEAELPRLNSKLPLCSWCSTGISLKLKACQILLSHLDTKSLVKARVFLCFHKPVGTAHMCNFFHILFKKFNSRKNLGLWPLNFLLRHENSVIRSMGIFGMKWKWPLI